MEVGPTGRFRGVFSVVELFGRVGTVTYQGDTRKNE